MKKIVFSTNTVLVLSHSYLILKTIVITQANIISKIIWYLYVNKIIIIIDAYKACIYIRGVCILVI